MNKIYNLAAKFTMAGRRAAVKSGSWCKTYHFGGRAWNEAVARATAIVNQREVVARHGYAGYTEGFKADGTIFHRGGIGPL